MTACCQAGCRAGGGFRVLGRGAEGGGRSGWPGRCAEPGEGGGEVGGPGPVLVEPELPAPPGPDQAGGHAEDAVAERGRLAAGQLAGEAQRLGPGDQVGGGQGQFQPGLVLLVSAAGQVPQPGCLLGPDPVLDPGVGPVPDFQVRELPAASVGEERGEPVPADIGEPQLRAGGAAVPGG